ncbi:MAG: trypsin-like peptidase domain-containing protein, partial [Spirochaeta sp.]|nr:trypsin-like peptidase domain-containing protein [Spirochaeta sp.]
MSSRKLLFSRNFFVFNLVALGVLLGFVLSMILFSCSTRVEPSQQTRAQEYELPDMTEMQHSFSAIAEAVLPSVVTLNVEAVQTSQSAPGRNLPWFDFFFQDPDSDEDREFRTQGLGSGVIVRRDGDQYYILTNDHVLGDAQRVVVVLDDQTEYLGSILGTDKRQDLALISFEAPDNDIPTARLGDSSELSVGDWVLAIGSPFGFQSTVTAGIVSALGRRGGPQGNISDFIQTDAAINQGNSGGALVSMKGEVVGINTWITSQTGGSVGIGFSIPINNARRAIDDFIELGEVRYGWLGVSIRSVSADIVDEMELPSRGGAIVQHVFRGSPADTGGVLPGDFITQVNGQPVSNSDELVMAVGELVADTTAEFQLIRDGEPVELSVRITAREDELSIADQNRNLWPGFSVFSL